jgi:hypothetical protein
MKFFFGRVTLQKFHFDVKHAKRAKKVFDPARGPHCTAAKERTGT